MRRDFLVKMGIALTGPVLLGPTRVFSEENPSGRHLTGTDLGTEISPTENLMRAHGLLERILLIYDEIRSRLEGSRDFPPEVLVTTARMVRRFVENYHNNMEQGYLFPHFEKANKHADLVRVLGGQHRVGRFLTGYIVNNVVPTTLEDPEKKRLLAHRIDLFARMYRPHAAFEDTVLFPAYRAVVSVEEFVSAGKQMEQKAQALFGADGFNEAVDVISEQEKRLGIHDLSQFTPRKDSSIPDSRI